MLYYAASTGEGDMYTLDLLEQAHVAALRSVDGLPILGWHIPGVYGDWSVKDIFAYFTSCQYVMLDIFASVTGETRTPALDRWLKNRERYDAVGVARRRNHMVQVVLDEYNDVHMETINQLIRIPDQLLRQKGTLPWYGEEYDLEQFITYVFYHHMRDLADHIAAFRDRMLRAMSKEHILRPEL
jgi:hypothetical protein